VGGDVRGALGLSGPRPSPRLGPATGGVVVGSSRTPRGLSIASHSPQITPRNQNPPASPTRRPSPRASPRGLTSPRHGASERATFVSPRVPSPRTTPRGSLVPSPRKPLEALPATLTLQQHQKMESMLNRIDTLEGMVTRTLAENRRLQAQVTSAKRASSNRDVCEIGEDDKAMGPAAAVVQQIAAAPGEHALPAAARAPRAMVWFCDEPTKAAATQGDGSISAVLEAPKDERLAPACAHDVDSGIEAEEGDAGVREGAEAAADTGLDGVRRSHSLCHSAWEVDPAEVKRTRCIGRGACGTVWEGLWRRARVAIKDLDAPVGAAAVGDGKEDAMDHDKEMLASFRGEVAQLSSLRHPHILTFYGAVSRGDKLSMLVELMERDVRSYLRGNGREAALSARLRIGLGALSGVRYLHAQAPKVVHRDIKPENLLLSLGDSVVKICDLGLARHKQGAFLQTRHHGGTLSYVAPEVHRGCDIDEGCDVYAMAIVLWELTTLAVPFEDKPPQSIPGVAPEKTVLLPWT
jgi:hypothetical protein